MSREVDLSKEVLTVLREKYEDIFSAEKKVADFVLQNPEITVGCNVAALARHSGVSEATVVRLCHHIGYTGYYQFRIMLSRDLGRRQYSEMIPIESDDAVNMVFKRFAEAVKGLSRLIKPETLKECVNLIKSSEYVHIMATGNTSHLAQYMCFRMGRLGIKCTSNVAPEYFMNQVNLAGEGDSVIAISKSGASTPVLKGMELVRDKGLKSIAITAFSKSPLADMADHVLLTSRRFEEENYDKVYVHLEEMAVIDALLYFLTNEELIKTRHADVPELFLSDLKI